MAFFVLKYLFFRFRDIDVFSIMQIRSVMTSYLGRQRGRVVRAPNLKSGGHGFKSCTDHLAGVVSRWTLVQLLGHACK